MHQGRGGHARHLDDAASSEAIFRSLLPVGGAVVCTANDCRSPIAERLAVMWAFEDLGPEADRLRIESAGVAALVGQEVDLRSATATVRLGGSPRECGRARLTAEVAGGAELVLTMTRQQRRCVLGLAPRSLHRTFKLLETAELLELDSSSG